MNTSTTSLQDNKDLGIFATLRAQAAQPAPKPMDFLRKACDATYDGCQGDNPCLFCADANENICASVEVMAEAAAIGIKLIGDHQLLKGELDAARKEISRLRLALAAAIVNCD